MRLHYSYLDRRGNKHYNFIDVQGPVSLKRVVVERWKWHGYFEGIADTIEFLYKE